MPQAMRFSSNPALRWFGIALFLLALLARPAACAQGIDVSKYQGKINWTKVAKTKKVKFVYIRATEGATIRDKFYQTNLTAARKAGILVGSYHVYSSKTTAYQQFANFKAMVPRKSQDLIPVLDIEGHHSGRLYMGRVDKLLELMEAEYGVKPMIYTSEKVYKEHFASRKYRKYHIFVAKYEGYPVIRFTLWQHSKTGRVKGIAGAVDLDKFHSKHSLADIRMPRPRKKNAAAQAAEADTSASAAAPPAT